MTEEKKDEVLEKFRTGQIRVFNILQVDRSIWESISRAFG